MIPTTPATRALLRDLDARNRATYADLLLRERIRDLIRDFMAPAPRAAALVQVDPPRFDGRQRMASAPAPSDGAGVVGIPVPAAVPPLHRRLSDMGRAPAAGRPATGAPSASRLAAHSYAGGPTPVGRPGDGASDRAARFPATYVADGDRRLSGAIGLGQPSPRAPFHEEPLT